MIRLVIYHYGIRKTAGAVFFCLFSDYETTVGALFPLLSGERCTETILSRWRKKIFKYGVYKTAFKSPYSEKQKITIAHKEYAKRSIKQPVFIRIARVNKNTNPRRK